MSAPELLPCPFCGCRAEIERQGNRRQSTIYQCQGCSCSLETGEEFGHGKDWNTRAAHPDPRDEVIAALVGALRNIAEGNLGDAAWQANYAKIKDVARAALAAAKEMAK